MAKEIDSFMTCPIGKEPSGSQDQGDVTVNNYASVDTGGKGGKEAVSTLMKDVVGHKPSGKRD